MGGFGMQEILIVVLILFLLFGATRLPQLAKSLGATRKAFKDGMREAEEEEKAEQQKLASPPPPPEVSAVAEENVDEALRQKAEARVEH